LFCQRSLYLLIEVSACKNVNHRWDWWKIIDAHRFYNKLILGGSKVA
jgi:hypothetical protein